MIRGRRIPALFGISDGLLHRRRQLRCTSLLVRVQRLVAGQVVNMRQGEAVAYARVLAKARQRGDVDAIGDLERIGPPPYESLAELGTHRKWAGAYEEYASTVSLLVAELLAPRTSLRDAYDLVTGLIRSQDHFFGPSMDRPFVDLDLRRLGHRFEVPVFVVQGLEDDYTPPEVSRSYLDWIDAPVKEFVGLEGAGHFALVSRASEFLAIMKERLRRLDVPAPLAISDTVR